MGEVNRHVHNSLPVGMEAWASLDDTDLDFNALGAGWAMSPGRSRPTHQSRAT